MKNVIPNFLLTVVLFFIFVGIAPAQMTISTVAGTGVAGYSGSGGVATSANINHPHGILVDSMGNVYVVEHGNNVVRKISPLGIYTIVAGTGVAGYSGDGGPATAAKLYQPFSIEMDDTGNLYISDNHSCVRKVNTSGVINTVVGSGVRGFSGDGGSALSARLNDPGDISFDSYGNMFIADIANNRIRKVSITGAISTYAGTGTAGYTGDGGSATSASFNSPNFLFTDVADNLFVTDNANHCIRKINTSGMISTVAGNGVAGYSGDGAPATLAQLYFPGGTTVDAAGNLFIADNINNRIRMVKHSGIISTVAGTGVAGFTGDGGPATSARFNKALDVVHDNVGNLIVSDFDNHRVREVTKENCSGLPDVGLISATTNFGCTPYTAVLRLFGGTANAGLSYQWYSSPDSIIFSAVVGATNAHYVANVMASVYYRAVVTCTLSGLTDTSMISHLRYGPPHVGDITGSTVLCKSSTVSLNNSTSGGTWSSSNILVATIDSFTGSVFAVAAGTSSITYTVTNPCGSTHSYVTVTVAPPLAPVVNLHLPDSVSTGAFATYQWYKNRVLIPGATSRTYNTTDSGDYDVVVTDGMGCKDSSMGLKPLELSFEDKKFATVISPNPATDEIRISSIIPLRRVVIKSVDGRDMKAELNDNVVNISTYPTGMYIISTYSQEGVLLHVSRFTKAK